MMEYLRDLVIKDTWLKLFSLGLAVLTWITVSYAVQRKRTPVGAITLAMDQLVFPRIPVVVLSSAQDARAFQVVPQDVEVTVQGDPLTLKKLQTSDIRALVDLTGVNEAENLWKRIEVATPAGVTYVRVHPRDAHIIFP